MISVLISRRIKRLDYLYKLLYAVVEGGGGYAAHAGGRGWGSCLQMKQFLVLHYVCFLIVKAARVNFLLKSLVFLYLVISEISFLALFPSLYAIEFFFQALFTRNCLFLRFLLFISSIKPCIPLGSSFFPFV